MLRFRSDVPHFQGKTKITFVIKNFTYGFCVHSTVSSKAELDITHLCQVTLYFLFII